MQTEFRQDADGYTQVRHASNWMHQGLPRFNVSVGWLARPSFEVYSQKTNLQSRNEYDMGLLGYSLNLKLFEKLPNWNRQGVQGFNLYS